MYEAKLTQKIVASSDLCETFFIYGWKCGLNLSEHESKINRMEINGVAFGNIDIVEHPFLFAALVCSLTVYYVLVNVKLM